MTAPATPPPTISVILPCYNAGPALRDAVESVRAQSRRDWELLVIDDGSTDGSASFVEDLGRRDIRVQLVTLPENRGAAAARNAGLARARGKYAAFLDADDAWHPEKLQRQIAAMQTRKLTLSATAYLRENVGTGRRVMFGVPPVITRESLRRTNVMGFSTVIYDLEHHALRQMPDMRRRQDFAFLLQLLGEDGEAGGVNLPLTWHVTGLNSLSSNKLAAVMDTWPVYRQSEGLGLAASAACFAQYLSRAVLRHKAPWLARKLGVLTPVPPNAPGYRLNDPGPLNPPRHL